MPTALVTGASRGIGLEFARQFAADGWRVHAGARDPARAAGLGALDGDVHAHRLDVADRGQIAALAGELAGAPVDVLVNNAGIWAGEAEWFGRVGDEAWIDEFRVHLMGSAAMAEAFAENLAASRRRTIVNISSGNGSFGWDVNMGDYPYNTSKAALNMATRSLAHDLAPRGIVVVAFTPGYVQTDMTGPDADLTPEQSVGGMRRVIDGLTDADSGTFRRWNGETVPW